jgi:hypothetical protein
MPLVQSDQIFEVEIALINGLGFTSSISLACFKDLANDLIVGPSHNLGTHL